MDLLEHITPHTLILTPNLRLSASLLKKYYQEQIAQGQTCWPTLNIIEISKWLQRTWKDYTAKQIEHYQAQLI
jgi:hypothetical protein